MTEMHEDMLNEKIFAPFDSMFDEIIKRIPGTVLKYSLHDLIDRCDFNSLAPTYQIELQEPNLEEKYRRKIVVIKKTVIEYLGEKCTQIMIQDVTAFHMVD